MSKCKSFAKCGTIRFINSTRVTNLASSVTYQIVVKQGWRPLAKKVNEVFRIFIRLALKEGFNVSRDTDVFNSRLFRGLLFCSSHTCPLQATSIRCRVSHPRCYFFGVEKPRRHWDWSNARVVKCLHFLFAFTYPTA